MKTAPRDYAAIIWFVGIIGTSVATLAFWEVAQVEKRIVFDVLFPGFAGNTTQLSAGRIVDVKSRPQYFAPSIFQGRLWRKSRRRIDYTIELENRALSGATILSYRTSTTWDSCPRQFDVGEVLHLYLGVSEQSFAVKECYDHAQANFVWALLRLLACPLFAFATYKLWRMR